MTRKARRGADPGPILRGGRGVARSNDGPASNEVLWLWIPAFAGMTAVVAAGAQYITGVIASEAKQSRAARETLDCFVASLLAMTEFGVGSAPQQWREADARQCCSLPQNYDDNRISSSRRPSPRSSFFTALDATTSPSFAYASWFFSMSSRR